MMMPVTIIAIATSLAVLWFYFQSDIPATYDFARLPLPQDMIRDRVICQWSTIILGLLPIGYWFAEAMEIPVSVLAFGTALCAIAFLAILLILPLTGSWFPRKNTAIISINKILPEFPWQVISFSLGMYIIPLSLGKSGITDAL